MSDINPIPYSLKRHRKILDDPHHAEFMTIVQGDGFQTEELLDLVLAFAEDHDWKHWQLLDHCFVAHILLLNQMILKGYPEDVPVPPVLMRLIRVISILDLTSASSGHIPQGRHA